MNGLAGEKSPYLLQHADNPVDWYPWGEAAFEKARREKKPIFLSIGYSTCHWCHVMERESFTDTEVASVLNEHFISVKVDREERPDVDRVYMTAAAGAGWGGGWPLSMWLTPELKPFFGGTYFPPESRMGRPGFPTVLRRLAEAWRSQREGVEEDAERLASALKGLTEAPVANAPFDPSWLDHAFRAISSDPGYSGERGPKFPMPVNQNFLLSYYARTGQREALETALSKLRDMASGGIYDHVGGGFHRYSVDGDWRVPHFEKMLYDNAQLAVNYIEAYQASKDPDLSRVARETLDYVLRDMSHPEGGFYSAEDADSPAPWNGGERSEGAFYLWSARETREVLGQAAAAVMDHRYGVLPDGNAPADPQGEFRGRNILYAARTREDTAREFGRTPEEISRTLEVAKRKLLESRADRPRPLRDDKILTSWNGLMISALARGYQVFEDPRYLKAGENAARFLRTKLYDPKTRRLYRRWRDGERAVNGMADDHAFLAQGLLDLYEASFDPDWLEWALDLTDTQLELFFDPESGVHYTTAKGGAPHLFVRLPEDSDNVEPGAGSVATLNMLRLSELTGRDDLREAAEKTLSRSADRMRSLPASMPQMLVAADRYAAPPRHIVIAGAPDDPATRELLRVIHSRHLPGGSLMVLPAGKLKERLAARMPFLKGMVPIAGLPTVYVCVDGACGLPTTDPKRLEELLD
ncbi:thioredoxin domain-containing protein [Elusimicrobiota bacterium]